MLMALEVKCVPQTRAFYADSREPTELVSWGISCWASAIKLPGTHGEQIRLMDPQAL